MDSEASAAYIRFGHGKVAKTLPRPGRGGFFSIDLDRNNRVLGIEVIGVGIIEISKVLKQAHVEAPDLDYSRTRFVNKSILEHA